MTLHGRPLARVAAYALLSNLAGCGGYEHRCDLNPYACSENGAGGDDPGPPAAVCGACEIEEAPAGCAPIPLPGDGACSEEGTTCSPDLRCDKAGGQPCASAMECATGVCRFDLGKCVGCSHDTDCAYHPDRRVCLAGWCRRPAGGDCVTSFACITNRCVNGLCTGCFLGQECASGKCDSDSGRCLWSAGEPCSGNALCASGKCVASRCAP